MLNNYFWRTWDAKELDLVEERGGKLYGYEFKWTDKITKPIKEWLATYPKAEFQVINQENFFEFIT